jgi:myo-inositol 2-dehydrogenase / D-chiro-inositol 1-dehydrogenase
MKKQTLPSATNHQDNVTRRRFLAGAGAAALSFSIVKPQIVRGQVKEKVRLGIVGCGGRGNWITDLFNKHGGYKIAAAADFFQDRADNTGNKFNLPQNRRYTGLKCCQKLLEDNAVDAIAIESPPYFHPEQAAAGVDAGVHVYIAKPIAVDAPGCLSIEASGKKATRKKLCYLIDFQTRANEFYIEALKRLHKGDLGEIAFGEAIYHAGCPFGRMYDAWKSGSDKPEVRLRSWGLDKVLSGDIITEQNIHTLDVMNWIMDVPPLYAVGTCGKTVRPVGTCADHFACLFQYPNNVGITFSSRQMNGHGTQPEGIRNRMFGAKGILETEYGGQVLIRGENFYRGGRTPGIYSEGAVTNIKTFYDDIQNKNYANPTVVPSVRSNLITVLGRTAAYQPGQVVSWDKMLQTGEKLEANLKGLKA